MRATSLCLVFGLVLLMAWNSDASQAAGVPEDCCFSFVDFQIPAKKIVSAEKTSSHCPVEGILVTTPRTIFCVKPDESWIKSVMQKQ
ncbi:hypothetical protein Q8A67_025163 [Cirrhinus molitorella]|uniref:Chemokine interleukin-8-like domain-containing protein n=1 Tax=Cirrhinus molitorella TaxID=172907 RepID=A0AA88NU27_9TELE|nr:hypothetical protein Q8A67_025163 [Cirrhinus molitorella]